jgi:hypothetical protein
LLERVDYAVAATREAAIAATAVAGFVIVAITLVALFPVVDPLRRHSAKACSLYDKAL